MSARPREGEGGLGGACRAADLLADPGGCGADLHALVAQLLPIPRSLTGDGVRTTLALLDSWFRDRVEGELAAGATAPRIDLQEVATGTAVLDWTVPNEWNLRRAWITGPDGRRVVDTASSALHVVGYSLPVRLRLSRAELDRHLHSLPEHPDWVPYRTSYYRETWGFCLPHRVREALPEGEYEVVIDATLEAGAMTWGELWLPGEEEGEILFSAHVCHPAMANDNASALAVSIALAAALAARPRRRFGYRFLWAPGTIGAINWLARNEQRLGALRAGLVLANLGDAGSFHYKQTRQGDAEIDRLLGHLLAAAGGRGERGRCEPFVPFGYDERQFNAPGFALPVGLLSRTPWGRYPQYHTSADDLSLVRPEALAASLALLLEVVTGLEENRRYRNLSPKGEPQLGRRGLYRSLGGGDDGRRAELALLWVLNQSDGRHDLLAIAERAGMPIQELVAAAGALVAVGLLEEER
jgi:aminopeptidase-like protein